MRYGGPGPPDTLILNTDAAGNWRPRVAGWKVVS